LAFSSVWLVVLFCTAQMLAQFGAYAWLALLHRLVGEWSLSNSEAG